MRTRPWIVACVVGGSVAAAFLIFTHDWGFHLDPMVPRHRVDMEQLRIALVCYRDEFRRWPEGDTSDILRALRGENTKRIVFLETKDKDPGVMLDPWGTPYRIQIVSNTTITASAGPNGKWDDGDDQELRRPEPAR